MLRLRADLRLGRDSPPQRWDFLKAPPPQVVELLLFLLKGSRDLCAVWGALPGPGAQAWDLLQFSVLQDAPASSGKSGLHLLTKVFGFVLHKKRNVFI